MYKKLLLLLGYKYILNTNTGEVHNIVNAKANCGIDNMSNKHKIRLTYRGYKNLQYTYVNGKYVNGCTHCNNTNNKDNE